MTRLGGHAFRALAAAAPWVALAHPACAQEPPFAIVEQSDTLPAFADSGDVLSSLKPIVKHFDFDDLQTGPNALPPNFYRYVAPSQGFPPFGEMRVVGGAGFVAPGAPAHLAGALEFELKGGSMSARIGTSVIPVLPFADYVVACRVRTEGLQRAHARLAAWLCDSSGRIIEGSRVESRVADAAERWDLLSIEMHGQYADAADLVFELRLAQPDGDARVARDVGEVPMIPETRGRAWFDDITISHLPRVALAMTQPGNIVTPGEAAHFAVQVNEPASRQLTAQLRVFDLDGRLVLDHGFPAPRGRDSTVIDADLPRCGWYRAVLDVTSEHGMSRRRWVDFLVLPDTARRTGTTPPFGVALDSAATLQDAEMATRIHCGTAVVPAWNSTTTLAGLASRAASRRTLIEHLLREHTEIAFALPGVPEELARASMAIGRGAVDVLGGDPAHWRPYLDDLLMQFGLSINRWIVGESDAFDAADLARLLASAERARSGLAAFVPKPELHLVWPVAQQPPADDQPSHVALIVPASTPPDSIDDFLEPWIPRKDRSAIVTLELLAARQYSPRQRLTDALQRGLYAWRAGASPVIIGQPWRIAPNGDSAPEVVVAAWNTLNAHLTGRRFVSELALGPDVHLWVAAGQDPTDALVVAWTDRESSADQASISVQLGDRELQVFDTFGNTSTIEPRDGLHPLTLTELPVFIPGVNLELVLFRSGVTIQPSFIPAASKVHEHHIVIHNPWDTAVSGTLRVTSEVDLQIAPSIQEFAVPAGGETRVPIQVIPQRGILAGKRVIPIEISLNADRTHLLRMALDVEVGLKDIEFNVASSSSRNPITGLNDLLISTAVTNRSDRPVNLDVDLLAENVSQMRRTIAALQPGQTQTRVFRIANGATILSGQSVRLGVAQRDGVARLNRIISIGVDGQTTEYAGALDAP